MKHFLYISLAAAALLGACATQKEETALPPEAFMRIEGQDLVTPGGEKFFIRGTNLGNWLNPEGRVQPHKFSAIYQRNALPARGRGGNS